MLGLFKKEKEKALHAFGKSSCSSPTVQHDTNTAQHNVEDSRR